MFFPGAVGGGNWNGVAVNQPLGLMFTNVMNAGQWGHLEPMTAGRGRRGAAPDGRGAPPTEGRGRLRVRCTAAGACERRRGAGDAHVAQGHSRGTPLLGSGDDLLVPGAAVG